MQSLVRNRALVDGNKRTAWPLHGRSFLYLNGVELDPDFDVDYAENFMNSVATEGICSFQNSHRSCKPFPRSDCGS